MKCIYGSTELDHNKETLIYQQYRRILIHIHQINLIILNDIYYKFSDYDNLLIIINSFLRLDR